ncbi:MAG: beta-lactamase family protein [Bacteriovorax sp.]|nr:beta-lactamase family protein [Bacteriovorax sp.]
MKILLSVMFLILLSCSTSSQNKNRSVSNIPIIVNSDLASLTWVDKVRDISQDSVDNGYNAGIALGIIDESGKQSIYTLGKMNVAKDKPILKSTLFEIASITKVLTSELLAKFAIEGKLNLDDKVSKFFPSLINCDVGRITLRELSTHSSGLPRMPNNMNPKNPTNPYTDYTQEQFMSFLQSYKEIKSKPYGYHYSNLAFALLGQILTNLNLKKDYEETLKQEILTKLNMPMTITLTGNQRNNFAIPYASTSVETSHWDLGVFNSAGGVRATIQDLLDFAQAQLKPESTSLKEAILLTQEIHYKGKDAQLGLGWYVRNHPDGLIYTKDGGTGGFSSLIIIQPKTGRALTLLTNNSNNVPCLVEFFKGEECRIKKTYSMSLKQLERFVGDFENDLGNKMSIVTSQNNKFLIVNIAKQQPWVLRAESSTIFNFTEIDAKIVFPEDSEAIKSLTLKQDGKDFIYKKIE